MGGAGIIDSYAMDHSLITKAPVRSFQWWKEPSRSKQIDAVLKIQKRLENQRISMVWYRCMLLPPEAIGHRSFQAIDAPGKSRLLWSLWSSSAYPSVYERRLSSWVCLQIWLRHGSLPLNLSLITSNSKFFLFLMRGGGRIGPGPSQKFAISELSPIVPHCTPMSSCRYNYHPICHWPLKEFMVSYRICSFWGAGSLQDV